MTLSIRTGIIKAGITHFALAIFFLAGSSLWAQEPELESFPVRDHYRQLREARIASVVAATGQVLERDVHRFTFETGQIYFMEPVNGRIMGAVFEGKGLYSLKPEREPERRQLDLSSSGRYREAISEPFESLLLWFSDDSAGELSGSNQPGQGSLEAGDRILKKYRKDLDNDLEMDLELRVLESLHNGGAASSPLFLVVMDLKKLPTVIAGVDPLGLDAIRRFPNLRFGGATSFFIANEKRSPGIWYLDHGKEGPLRDGNHQYVDVLHYDIKMNIQGYQDFDAATRLTFKVTSPQLSVLPLQMARGIRVSAANLADEQGAELEIKAQVIKDRDAAVLFSQPLELGRTYQLQLEYRAREVMYDVGNGVYLVTDRTSWYPNPTSFNDKAMFTMRFETARDHKLVATALLKNSRIEGKRAVTEWETSEPQTTAGFNYGIFEEMTQQDQTGIQVSVHRGRDMPDNMVANVMADTRNSLRLYSEYFGPLEYTHISVTQQAQSGFGQAWPMLVFLPYASFTSNTGYGQEANEFYAEVVTPHEVAHQWWGHHITARTYRDQWIEEGFAHFSAGLLREMAGGQEVARNFWETQRDAIMQKSFTSKMLNYEAGPITQGLRLASENNPLAYQVLAYSKGAFVVHMLRMLMRDRRNPDTLAADAAFKAMMRDFFLNRPSDTVSTKDFKAIVEKHVPSQLKANGSMDWFFDQWVYGSEIPDYVTDIAITQEGSGQYRVKGTIQQVGVSEDFRMWVPLYMKFGRDRYLWFGTMPFVGEQTQSLDALIPMPEKPSAVLVNACNDVLTRTPVLEKKKKKR